MSKKVFFTFSCLLCLAFFPETINGQNIGFKQNDELVRYINDLVFKKIPVDKEHSVKVHLLELKKITKGDLEELLVQVIYQVQKGEKEGAYHEAELLDGVALIGWILRDLDGESKIKCAIRLQQEAADLISQKSAWFLFSIIEEASWNEDAPNFTPYENFLQKKKVSEISLCNVLLEYLFQRNPSNAFNLLLDYSGLTADEKQTLFENCNAANSQFKDKTTKSSGEDLSIQTKLMDARQTGPWWIDLYVAELVRQTPSLQSAEIVRDLKEVDKHFVSESLRAIEIQDLRGIEPPDARWKVLFDEVSQMHNTTKVDLTTE